MNLGSLNYIVCAEHLTDNGMLVAVAGVQLYSWFSIMSLNGRPAADIKSFLTEAGTLHGLQTEVDRE